VSLLASEVVVLYYIGARNSNIRSEGKLMSNHSGGYMLNDIIKMLDEEQVLKF
jgi:hypothetical protein